MSFEPRTTPEGQEVQVFIRTKEDDSKLEAWYEKHGVGENIEERIEFLKNRTKYTHSSAETPEEFLRSLERAALIEVL